MGSLVAPIGEDGTLQTHTTSADSLTAKSSGKNSTIDSDMFLTLLVAEMQNQDPLEPTSNTEWVSQYATFTQVEKMSEMAEAVDMLRANDLIGKEVIMKTTSEKTGEVSYTQGVVDYVLMENNKPILIINDQKYSISDLDTVISDQYSTAYDKYSTLKGMIDGLPDIQFADKTYENVIRGAYEYYETFDEYQQNFMATYGAEQMDLLNQWKSKLETFGIKFDETEPEESEPTTSLDDILESFNTKMDAILNKLNLFAETSQAGNTSSGTNTPSGTNTDSEKVQTPEESGNGTTDETSDSVTESGETEETGNGTTGSGETDETEETGNDAAESVVPGSGVTDAELSEDDASENDVSESSSEAGTA